MTYSITDDYSTDTFHIVWDKGYTYIVKVDYDDWEKLKDIRNYTYNYNFSKAPDSVTIYGMPVLITDDIKSLAIKTINDFENEVKVNDYNFENYFGIYYLDTTLNPMSNSLGMFAIIISIIVTVGILLLACYLRTTTNKKFIALCTIFLVFTWIMFFVVIENDTLAIMGFYFIMLATAVWIYSLVKGVKKNNSIQENKVSDKVTIKTKNEEQNNEFVGKSKEKILQIIYEKYDKFMNECGIYLLFFSGWLDSWKREPDLEKKEWYVQTSKEEFISSLFLKLLINVNDKDKKKTIVFLKNLDSDILEELEVTYSFDKEKILKAIEEENNKSYQEEYASIDFNKWLKFAFNKLAFMRNSDWVLTEDIWKNFIMDIQNAYNAYVTPEIPVNLMGQYGKTSVQNESESSNKAFLMFYLPIFLIIGMVIKFLTEIFGEKGIVLSGGWWSVIIFVAFIIWAAIGSNGKNNTCSNCKKWNSLKLESDTIIDSRETFRTKTRTTSSGSTYKVQVAVRIDKHEEHYTCQHCGNKEVKYTEKEYEL